MNDEARDDHLPALFNGLDGGPELGMALELAAERLFGELMPTPRIARFEIDRVIGSGGMGIVYAARDPETGREVALKLVSSEALASSAGAKAGARLAREALVASRLRHPTLVRVRESGEHEGQPYLVMDLIDGEPLDRWALRARPQLAELLDIFVRAGEGLAAAHSAGYVHRDFKPGNVLIDAQRRPHIVDFGLARPLSSEQVWAELGSAAFEFSITGAGRVSGTPGYMAPELFSGVKASPRSDIYAFCVSLRELLEHLEITASEPVEQLLARGLTRDPRARTAKMVEVLGALVRANAALA